MFHLVTDCNRLGTSRGFFNEIWVASACIARITGYSETVRRAGRLFGKLPISRHNAARAAGADRAKDAVHSLRWLTAATGVYQE
jgi:hypothetical protein